METELLLGQHLDLGGAGLLGCLGERYADFEDAVVIGRGDILFVCAIWEGQVPADGP